MNESKLKPFKDFLSYGNALNMLLGSSYNELVRNFNLNSIDNVTRFGDGQHLFQEAVFWFTEHGVLQVIELYLDDSTWDSQLPTLFNEREWLQIVSSFTPTDFEQFILEHRIPCLRAKYLRGNEVEVTPPTYVLDHNGLVIKFSDSYGYSLNRIDIRLMRHMPNFEYSQIYPIL